MSSSIRKSERPARPARDAERTPDFHVALKTRGPLGKTPPPDRVDHSHLLTLQNLGGISPETALIPLFFNSLQRHVGPMFKPEMAGNDLEMGPYKISGVNGWIRGVESTNPDGSRYGIRRDRKHQFYLTIDDTSMSFAAGSPAQQERAVAMLRQTAFSAHASIGPTRQPRMRNQ
jgi:hypothetical protein